MAIVGETVRVLGWVALSTLSGPLCALTATVTAAARMRGGFAWPGGAVVLCTIVGWFLSGLLVPLLWRRPFGAAIVRTIPAGVGVAGLLALLAPAELAAIAGMIAIGIAALLAAGALPIVFPEMPRGLCPRCGYPWRGLTVPTCPECGTPLDVAPPTVAPPFT